MSPDVLKELQLQANYPRGIAARVDSADLKRLLEERAAALDAVRLLLNSAHPNAIEHPAMMRAWRVGAEALTVAKADAP